MSSLKRKILSCNMNTLSRLYTTWTEYKHSHGQKSKQLLLLNGYMIVAIVILNNGCCCTWQGIYSLTISVYIMAKYILKMVLVLLLIVQPSVDLSSMKLINCERKRVVQGLRVDLSGRRIIEQQ